MFPTNVAPFKKGVNRPQQCIVYSQEVLLQQGDNLPTRSALFFGPHLFSNADNNFMIIQQSKA